MIKSIMNAVKTLIKDASFNVEYQGRIVEVLGNFKYEVEIGGATYVVSSSLLDELVVNTSVRVIAPNNQFKNIYISGVRR